MVNWSPTIDSQSITSQVFAVSLFPYINWVFVLHYQIQFCTEAYPFRVLLLACFCESY
ncbi:hypothetical protein HanRHA438_Chr02g0082521 [Helianthus annuus]|nr:hypothetical protein HanRHA438_Chr02g0082521 [Helianthus annuus]